MTRPDSGSSVYSYEPAQETITVEWHRCTGCRLCEMACSFSHDDECNPRLSRIRVVRLPDRGMSVPSLCVQCTTRPCVEVCPVGAVSRDSATGANLVDEGRCIGCKECVVACPFGAMTLHQASGTAIVCDMCHGDPACVRVCSPRALVFRTGHAANMKKRREHAVLHILHTAESCDQ